MINKLHYISQDKTPQEHLNNIQNACASGIELVQLRLKNMNKKTVFETVKKAKEITDHFQTRLIITGYYKIAAELKVDGVSLECSDICPTVVRKELASWQTIGGIASTLENCKLLIDKKVDYIELGPFRLSDPEKNLATALGEEGYLSILSKLKTEIPVIATGGITINDVLDVMIAGVHGIAVSEEITRDFNSILKFKELVNGVQGQEQRWEPGVSEK